MCEGLRREKLSSLKKPYHTYAEGRLVRVIVELEETTAPFGSPTAIRQTMHEFPHLSVVDTEEMEEAIKTGQLPVQENTVFDDGR